MNKGNKKRGSISINTEVKKQESEKHFFACFSLSIISFGIILSSLYFVVQLPTFPVFASHYAFLAECCRFLVKWVFWDNLLHPFFAVFNSASLNELVSVLSVVIILSFLVFSVFSLQLLSYISFYNKPFAAGQYDYLLYLSYAFSSQSGLFQCNIKDSFSRIFLTTKTELDLGFNLSKIVEISGSPWSLVENQQNRLMFNRVAIYPVMVAKIFYHLFFAMGSIFWRSGIREKPGEQGYYSILEELAYVVGAIFVIIAYTIDSLLHPFHFLMDVLAISKNSLLFIIKSGYKLLSWCFGYQVDNNNPHFITLTLIGFVELVYQIGILPLRLLDMLNRLIIKTPELIYKILKVNYESENLPKKGGGLRRNSLQINSSPVNGPKLKKTSENQDIQQNNKLSIEPPKQQQYQKK